MSSIVVDCGIVDPLPGILVIPYGVTDFLSGAFDTYTALHTAVLPDSVTSIGAGVLSGTPLASINIPNAVKSIGYGAFDGCNSLASLRSLHPSNRLALVHLVDVIRYHRLFSPKVVVTLHSERWRLLEMRAGIDVYMSLTAQAMSTSPRT